MTPPSAPLAYTRDEAAQTARVSKDRIDRAIRTGELKAKRPKGANGKPGRAVVIPANALAQWLENEPDA